MNIIKKKFISVFIILLIILVAIFNLSACAKEQYFSSQSRS